MYLAICGPFPVMISAACFGTWNIFSHVEVLFEMAGKTGNITISQSQGFPRHRPRTRILPNPPSCQRLFLLGPVYTSTRARNLESRHSPTYTEVYFVGKQGHNYRAHILTPTANLHRDSFSETPPWAVLQILCCYVVENDEGGR